jgi:hypothetical protein
MSVGDGSTDGSRWRCFDLFLKIRRVTVFLASLTRDASHRSKAWWQFVRFWFRIRVFKSACETTWPIFILVT